MNEIRVRGTRAIYQDSGRRSNFELINFKELCEVVVLHFYLCFG
jgi:hypothetical protein